MSDSKRPNIIYIMADDHGPWAFGKSGAPNSLTPHLDRLADQGAILRKYFGMSAVCSPARACMATGLYSTETGIPDFLGKDPDIGLEPDYLIWPKALRDAGYATSLFGKWHMGEQDRHHPTRHGYQEFKGWRIGAGISKNPTIEIDGKNTPVEGYTPDIITGYAIDFMQRHKHTPFLLSLHFWAPHANQGVFTEDGDRTWHPLKEEDWAPFKDMDPVVPNPDYPKLDIARVKRMTREYMAAVHSIDRNIGKLMQNLEKLGIAEHTIVIYTSDNGYNLGHNGIWHKGNGWWILTDNRDGDRPNLYDNTLRLPAIIRWPGVTAPGSEVPQTVSSLDWFDTLCTAAGADHGDFHHRGRNLRPLFEQKTNHWDNDLFAQYEMWDWNQTGASLRTYRTPTWKLVRDFKKTVPDELYYLYEDPGERHNLINVNESQVQKHREMLNAKMLERMREINDPALSLD